MELKEFVKQTLLQISSGVSESQDAVRRLGGVVNPSTPTGRPTDASYFITIGSGQHVFLVDFDVAVSATDAIEGGGDASLAVVGLFSAKGGGKKTKSSESTSRIKFKVPLALPVDDVSKTEFDHRRREQDAKFAAHNRTP